jgi:tripartite-type tricarboxylate transporter receptor subunit TctC
MQLRPDTRRHLMQAVACTILAASLPVQAQSPAFPTKPVRIVVPFPPGGATDILARLLADKLAPALGKPVIVDNKAGSSGVLGTDIVAKSPADGHTLVLSLSNSLLTNQFLYARMPYEISRDLTFVYQIATGPVVLLVHPSIPANTAQELLKHVSAKKGKLSYGSWGIGSYAHLAGAHMSATQKAEMSHIPYKGEAAMIQDLLGGQLDMAYASALQAKPHIEAGKLKAIGVTGENRMATLPNVPTLREQGLTDEAYRVTGWLGIAVPAGTPPAVVRRIAAEVRAAVQLPDVRDRIAAMGFEVRDSSPEAFAAVYKKELPIWERLIKQSGATLD